MNTDTRTRVSGCPDGTYTGPAWPWLTGPEQPGRHHHNSRRRNPLMVNTAVQYHVSSASIPAGVGFGHTPQHERCECRDGEPRRGRHRTVGETKMRRCVVSAIVQH